MIFTWEPNDIKGGQRLRRLKDEPCMIGYYVPEPTAQRYALIDLGDGAVMQFATKEVLAGRLTTEGYKPDSIGVNNGK